MKKENKYKIIVSKTQLIVINKALEVLSRLHSGQWYIVFNKVFRDYFGKKHKYYKYYEKLDEIFDVCILKNNSPCGGTFYRMLDIMKEHLLGEEVRGVQHPEASEEMNIAIDIQQVVRTKLNDKRIPVQWSKNEILPNIDEIIPDVYIDVIGIYKDGLTTDEIKRYLKIIAQKEKIKTSTAKLYKKFCKIAGNGNTMSLVHEYGKEIVLMYRHDVERFAKKLFYNINTYFD